MMGSFWKKVNRKMHIILPLITLLCLAGFLGSLIFPDTVLDTFSVNMEEEEGDTEVALTLNEGDHIGYVMNTNGLPMRGIQVGINKLGQQLTGNLHYDVYIVPDNFLPEATGDTVNGMLVSSNVYSLQEGFDLQYVYLPYDNYKQCIGMLYIDFYTEGEPLETALMANHTLTDKTQTVYSKDSAFSGSIKCSYIYTHNTYPFLYDFRILTFVFLAVSMTLQYPKRKKGDKSHE